MPPRSKVWKLDKHTLGKHLVLRNYLDAWLPILGKFNQKVLIIDGFSGPGEYAEGEEGSPQIMINAFLEHYYNKHLDSEFIYYFIEDNRERFTHLQKLLKAKYPQPPKNLKFKCFNSTFDGHLDEVLQQIVHQQNAVCPLFAMVDPFGVSDTPMRLIAQIMANPKSEVFVSFMYDFINRFKKSNEFEKHLTGLFGTEDWKKAIDIIEKNARKQFLCELYKKQLKNNGAEHVIYFDLYNDNRLVYTIFFASNHWKGADKMKAAIWKAIPDGSFSFKGSATGSIISGGAKDYQKVLKQILQQFDDKRTNVAELQAFIGSEKTDIPSDGFKSHILKPMEKNGHIEPVQRTRSRSFTYPDTFEFKIIAKPNVPPLTENLSLL